MSDERKRNLGIMFRREFAPELLPGFAAPDRGGRL